MSSTKAINQSNLMIIILWGLIFSKCLTLEYLIQVYSIPVNSFFYIWLLTLTMASVATIAFFRTNATEIFRPKTIPIIHFIWFGCGGASLLLIGILSLLTELNPYTVPAILSIALGIGYLGNGIFVSKKTYILSGIGWWIGAATLAARNNVESLSIFAFLMILLTVLPLIIEMRQQKIAFI
ncbi:MAG: hypothetical protein ACJAT5_000917 [Lentimonas sp.]|jgi:hypothetical protein